MGIQANDVTLFVGMLLIVVLYVLARLSGGVSLWSAVGSFVTTFLLYLGLNLNHTANLSGDQLAIHFALYLVTAGLLVLSDEVRYRERKVHWAPKALIVFFVVLLIVNAILVTVAKRGLPQGIVEYFLPTPPGASVHTGFPGVVPYDKNLLYGERQGQQQAQIALGWQIDVTGLEELKVQQASLVMVHIRDKSGRDVVVDQLRLEFWWMASSQRDVFCQMAKTAPGHYRCNVRLPEPGAWVLNMQVWYQGKLYELRRRLLVGER